MGEAMCRLMSGRYDGFFAFFTSLTFATLLWLQLDLSHGWSHVLSSIWEIVYVIWTRLELLDMGIYSSVIHCHFIKILFFLAQNEVSKWHTNVQRRVSNMGI